MMNWHNKDVKFDRFWEGHCSIPIGDSFFFLEAGGFAPIRVRIHPLSEFALAYRVRSQD